MTTKTKWTEQFFLTHPVFRTEEFLAAARPSSEQTARDLLKHHRRSGRITPVRRGLWHAPLPGRAPAPPDAVVVAARVAPDAVIGLHTAITLHGAGYSHFQLVTCFTASDIRPFDAANATVRAVPHPRALVTGGHEHSHTEIRRVSGVDVRVTSRERTLVDMLDRQDLSGGIEEVWRSANQLGWLDGAALLDYLDVRGSATLVARAGYLLEQCSDQLRIPAETLAALHERRRHPTGVAEFAPGEPGPRTLVSAWKLSVPASVVDRAWEEPHAW